MTITTDLGGRVRRLDSGFLERLSAVHLAITVVGAVGFWGAFLAGMLQSAQGTLIFHLLYGFNTVVIAVSIVLLAVGGYALRERVLVIAGLAIGFWLLGSFYWTSYQWLGGQILAYGSVNVLAFQTFHLTIIVVVLSLMRQRGQRVWRPSVLAIVALAALPSLVYVQRGLPVASVLFSTTQLALSGGVGVLAVHLLARRTYPLVGLALLGVTVADIVFQVVTFIDQAPIVVYLDPLWFSSFVVLSFGLLRYAAEERLP